MNCDARANACFLLILIVAIGLGVMAQLMGKNLEHQDLIWVVPCVGGIEYPIDEVAPPMTVAVFGLTYNVNVRK